MTATSDSGSADEVASSGGLAGGTPALTLSTSNAAGVAATAVRTDATIALFDATAPTTQAFGDAAAVGSAAIAARRDHKHGMMAAPSGGTPALVLSTSNAAGAASTFLRTNDQIAVFDATVPTTSAVGDAAAAGSAAVAARRDHLHGRESFGGAPPTIGVAAAGVATTPSRSDHNHQSLLGTPLTTATSIANQQTLTTGGVTYAAPALASGHVYRIRAHGQYVAANSATVRSGQIAPFWGTTQLNNLASSTVLASTAQTTSWEGEWILVGTSTTAIWLTYQWNSRIGSATLQALSAQTGVSTTVTAGAQTLDLRFATSASVVGDSWTVAQVTIERLQ